MTMRNFVVSACLLIWLASPALAVQPDEILKDPALEARARNLSRELRCMVCQNQSIDDSDAPLARDLRVLVRERLQKGDSDAQVMAFLVARYGEFVLLKPSFSAHNALLWLVSPLVLAIGGAGLWLGLRKRRGAAGGAGGAPTLSADELRRVERLLDEQNPPA